MGITSGEFTLQLKVVVVYLAVYGNEVFRGENNWRAIIKTRQPASTSLVYLKPCLGLELEVGYSLPRKLSCRLPCSQRRVSGSLEHIPANCPG